MAVGKAVAAALLACLVLASGVAAQQQQQQQQQHPLTNLPAPGDVSTGYLFPEHMNKRFPAGKVISVVLGLHNDASESYNITAIMGSLNSPTDFNMYIQNFTQQVYHEPVAAGHEISLEYKFMPDPRLEPREFIVALTVFYHDNKGTYFSNTFFNQTIDIVEVKQMIDYEMISLVFMIGGIAAGAGWLVWQQVAPVLTNMGMIKKQKRTKRTAVKVESAEKVAADDEDWLKGTNYDTHRKRKAAQKTKA